MNGATANGPVPGDPSAPKVPSDLDCISCGLCIPTCPTWQHTGRETQSPRGRVRLMRAMREERLPADATIAQEMEDCLVCRRCESVCPAGVSFGALMEETRENLREQGFGPPRRARLLLRTILKPRRLHFGMTMLAWLQRRGWHRRFGAWLANLPAVPSQDQRASLPDFAGAHHPRVGEVWLLEGCVMPELYGRVNRGALGLLQRLGYDVRVPKPRWCCGALHAHAGDGPTARDLARKWRHQLRQVGTPDAILSTSAGCGAHLQTFDHLAPPEPGEARFADLVMDVSTFLARRENLARLQPLLQPLPEAWLPLAYDDPCHLCHGQQVRREPRALLDAIPGVHRVELERAEECCGSAGLHGMLHPESARQQLAPKLADLAQSGAATLVTGNPGCHMQWDVGQRDLPAPRPVRHLIEVLDQALGS